MENESAAAKPKRSLGKRLLKIGFITVVTLVVLVQVVGWIWRYSGSNEWKFVGEKKGIKIYSLKTPGSDLQKFKAVFRLHSSLSGIVRLMQDVDACGDLHCYGSRLIEKVDDRLQYATFRYKFDQPFLPREYVVRTEVHQNPETKEVFVAYTAALGKIPLDPCCVRVADFNNMWHLTPLGNGDVDVDYTINMDEGGFLPKIAANYARPKFLFIALPHLQKVINKDKYRTAQLSYIQEK